MTQKNSRVPTYCPSNSRAFWDLDHKPPKKTQAPWFYFGAPRRAHWWIAKNFSVGFVCSHSNCHLPHTSYFSTCFSCLFFQMSFWMLKEKTQQMVSFRKTPAFGSIEAAAQILEEKTFQRPWRGSEGSWFSVFSGMLVHIYKEISDCRQAHEDTAWHLCI